MKIPPIGSAVLVSWLDSVDQPGWHYYAQDQRPNFGLRLPMQTRGILVTTDATSLSVATTIAPKGPEDSKEGYLDVLSIPRGCVVGIRVIP